MFLNNNAEYNAFSKALHADLMLDPKVKISDSWNALSAKIAKAIAVSKQIENPNFNINTLKSMYDDNIIDERRFSSKLEDALDATDDERSVIETLLIKDHYFDIIDFFINDIIEGVKYCYNHEDTDLYSRVSENTYLDTWDAAFHKITTRFSPQERTEKLEVLMHDLMHNLSYKTIKEHERFLSKEDFDNDPKEVMFITASCALKEIAKDDMLMLLNIIGSNMQSRENYEVFIKESREGIFAESIKLLLVNEFHFF